MEHQYRNLLKEIEDAKASLEKDAGAHMKTIIPEIQEQLRTMEDIQKRVELARQKLTEQTDMVIFTKESEIV